MKTTMAQLARHNAKRAQTVCALCLAVSLAAVGSAQAQATGAPHDSKLVLGTGLYWDYNPAQIPGGTNERFGLAATLDYALGWRTPTTELSFELNADAFITDENTSLFDPKVTLGFAHEEARSAYFGDIFFHQGALSSGALTQKSDGSAFVAVGDGLFVSRGVSLGFEAGLDNPISYGLNASYADVGFDSVASVLNDNNRSFDAGATLSAAFSAMTELSFDGSYHLYEADDAEETKREQSKARVTLMQRVDRITTARLSLGYETYELAQLSGDTTYEDVTLGLAASREHRGGYTTLKYTRDLMSDDSWSRLVLSRESTLKESEILWSLGMVDTGDGNIEMSGAFSYLREVKEDQFSVNLERKVGTDDSSQVLFTHRASVSLDHAFDDISGIGLSLAALSIEAPSETEQSADLRLSYRRDLSDQLGLEAGVRVRYLDDPDDDPATSGSVFVNFTRAFETR